MTEAPARITDRFVVEEVPGRSRGGRQLVRLCVPLEYRVGAADSLEIIVVPQGFVTDFASIPWGLRNTFPPLGLHARPAIVHDFLYRVAGLTHLALQALTAPGGRDGVEGPMLRPGDIEAYLALTEARPEVNRHVYSRAMADDIFREAMAAVGVGVVKRNIMHRAVRLGGGRGWGH